MIRLFLSVFPLLMENLVFENQIEIGEKIKKRDDLPKFWDANIT